MMATFVALLTAAGAAATGAVHRYALRRSILDLPNGRSSHHVPTPRGGGLAIAALLLVGLAAGAWADVVPQRLALALGVGGGAVACVGWIDDLRGVAARYRAAVHLAAAAWAVALLGGMPALRLGTGALFLGFVGSILAVGGIVWFTNLYNFMDGIDGLAGSQAVAVGLAGAALSFRAGQPGIATAALLLAGPSAGFLVWNWAPARIFMGDVGSSLLGYAFGVLAVASERSDGLPLIAWMMLLGLFGFDATLTLVRRVAAGQRWYEAHRSHAYQRAVQAGMSHAAVSLSALAATVFLCALSAVGAAHPSLLLPCAGVCLAVLLILYAAVERTRPMWNRRR